MGRHYYISSFFWTTAAKLLSAVVGFVSVPLLMGWFGKGSYGIISLATACNAYMHILDLGMNTGAVKFYSAWKAQGRVDLIYKAAHSNISFYLVVAAINAAVLVIAALFGEGLFNVSHEQFLILRQCLLIIAAFSFLSWAATSFNQLLVADRRMDYTMKVQCVQALLKALLVAAVFWTRMDISSYFLALTATVSLLAVPYAWKCLKLRLIDSIVPKWDWSSYKPVLLFSLSIFALSLFQMTATQSRPIILSIFSDNAAETVADFRVLEVMPGLVIMIGGTFSAIFLPKASELSAKADNVGIQEFAYKWTKYTSIIATVLCVPFMLCASESLSAYVGNEYAVLGKWLALWCLTVLIQIHTTPGNSLILASGKTMPLVRLTAVACVISMIINALLAKRLGSGSAVAAYFVYVLIVIGAQYLYFYRSLVRLERLRVFKAFALPCLLAFAVAFLVSLPRIPLLSDGRWGLVLLCAVKSLLWLLPYTALLFLTGLLRLSELKSDYKR